MENIVFELNNISIQFLDKEIIKVDQLKIHRFDRIGIVGKNGAGKSTLLKLLAKEIQPTTGIVKQHVNVGYFEQISSPIEKNADGELLSRLGISHIRDEASGGEQTKQKLAQLFSSYYEALLIDEPTTHLDQDGISFIVEQLEYYYGALVIVSHDRQLLDQLVTTIWEISDGEVNVYKGNYTEYAAQKEQELEQQQQLHENYVKEKERLEKAVEEKMRKANNLLGSDNKSKQKGKEKPSRLGKTKSKATSQKGIYRAAKSMELRMEKLTKVEAVSQEKEIVFRQSKTIALHNKFPIMAEQLTLKANEQILLDGVSFQLPLGKKIALTGPNGSGKSTLLHHIVNQGEGLVLSPKAKMGLFQQMSYQFPGEESVIQFMRNRSQHHEGFLRSVLHAMQFTGTDLQKCVKKLSGGEAIRLQLCQLFLGDYNILLLDEPTNFLDIQALQALEKFMNGYEGTVIFVSHDEAFIDNVADIRYVIEPKKRNIRLL